MMTTKTALRVSETVNKTICRTIRIVGYSALLHMLEDPLYSVVLNLSPVEQQNFSIHTLKTVTTSATQYSTLCSKKSDAKIQITITTAYLIRIEYPLYGFNYHLSEVNVANFNKIHHIVSEQQLF